MNDDGRRVLFVDQEPRLSGGQLVLLDLLTGLSGRGWDVHLAVPGDGALPAAAAEAGVKTHRYELSDALREISRWQIGRRPLSPLGHAGDIRRSSGQIGSLIERLAPDVVHSNSLKAHLLTAPSARRRRRPHIWHVQDIVGGLARGVLATAAFAGASRIICCSEAVASALPSPLRRRVRVVHNSVSQQAASPEAAAAFRARLGVGEDECLVTMVGQIARWKAQDVFVAAVEHLRSRSDLRFAIVGSCLYPENEAGYEAETRARSARLAPLLTWAGAVQPIAPVMAASDIVVHASRLPEPFGRVIVEAMVQGTPVISNSIGAAPELVTPEVGVLVPPDDAEALAEAITVLADDPELRCAIAGRAPAHAARYSPERLVEGTLDVYAEVLGDD